MAFFRTVPFLVSVAAFVASSVGHAETPVSASPVKVSGFVDAQYQ